MTPPRKMPAREAAAAARIAAAVAQGKERRANLRAEYEERTGPGPGRPGLFFIKEFHDVNYALQGDPLESVSTRVLAWARRFSWGEYSLHAVFEDGLPKHQVDCARELGLNKRHVSKAVDYLQRRGYLEAHPKLITPVLAPELRSPAADDDKPTSWAEFIDRWKVAHSPDFAELEVARTTVSRIRKVMRAEYKKWWEQERARRASLLEIARQRPDGSASSDLSKGTPFEQNTRAHQKAQGETLPREGQKQADRRLLQASELLFSTILRMQQAFPKSSFSADLLDSSKPEHQQLIAIILQKLGTTEEEDVLGYLLWVRAQFTGPTADGGGAARERAPGKSGGPTGLGLLVNWAQDYARTAGLPGASKNAYAKRA